MKNYRTYSVSKLKKLVQESVASEFKPVMGKDVESTDKKNNEKAYDEILKGVAKTEGKFSKEKNFKLAEYDDNKGMESLRPQNANKSYKDRVEAQLKGFPSKQAEEIHKNEKLGNAEYGSDEVVKQFKDKAENSSEARKKATEIGLTGRELNKKEIDDQYKSMFNESAKRIKKLTFKNTVFMNEEHMLSRVPDMYMTEGNRFIMSDKDMNEYIVEWHANEPLVEKKMNMKKVLAEQAKIKSLFTYSNQEKFSNSTCQSRMNENKEISQMLGRVRQLMK